MPDAIKETLTDLLIIPPGVRRPRILTRLRTTRQLMSDARAYRKRSTWTRSFWPSCTVTARTCILRVTPFRHSRTTDQSHPALGHPCRALRLSAARPCSDRAGLGPRVLARRLARPGHRQSRSPARSTRTAPPSSSLSAQASFSLAAPAVAAHHPPSPARLGARAARCRSRPSRRSRTGP